VLSTTTGAHRDGRAPSKERCSIEEIPEGFTLAGAKLFTLVEKEKRLYKFTPLSEG